MKIKKILNYKLNIDTLCFKIDCTLLPIHYEKWETKNARYIQTRRTIYTDRGSSGISIRYYKIDKRLSIWIDSVTEALYGSSQRMFDSMDFPVLLQETANIVNDITGLSANDRFHEHSFDKALLTRIDVNHDFYFTEKRYEIKFREWFRKFNTPYGQKVLYPTGGKYTTHSLNLTYYSKDEQCAQKHKNYINDTSDFCTRVEFQFKSGFFNRKKNKTLLLDFIYDEQIRYDIAQMILKRLRMDGELLNNGKYYRFLKKVKNEPHRRDFILNVCKFFKSLNKKGFAEAKNEYNSTFYNYLKLANKYNVVPIKLDDDVYREL